MISITNLHKQTFWRKLPGKLLLLFYVCIMLFLVIYTNIHLSVFPRKTKREKQKYTLEIVGRQRVAKVIHTHRDLSIENTRWKKVELIEYPDTIRATTVWYDTVIYGFWSRKNNRHEKQEFFFFFPLYTERQVNRF